MANQPVGTNDPSQQGNAGTGTNPQNTPGWWGFNDPGQLQSTWNSKAPGVVAALPAEWKTSLFPQMTIPSGTAAAQGWQQYFNSAQSAPTLAGPGSKAPATTPGTTPPTTQPPSTTPPIGVHGNNWNQQHVAYTPPGSNSQPGGGAATSQPWTPGAVPTAYTQWLAGMTPQLNNPTGIGGYAGTQQPNGGIATQDHGLISAPIGTDPNGFNVWSPGARRTLGFGETVLGSGTNPGSLYATGKENPWSPGMVASQFGGTAGNLNPGVPINPFTGMPHRQVIPNAQQVTGTNAQGWGLNAYGMPTYAPGTF